MLSDAHASVVQSCVEAVLDSTLPSSAPTNQEEAAQLFRALHASVLSAARSTLAQRARALNAHAPVNRLPPELLCRVAAHLPFGARCAALLVCGRWAAVLLADGALWTRVALALRHAPRRWPAAVAALLARSRGRPLALSVQCEAPAYAHAAAADVARVVALHMPRVAELALALSSAGAACWIGVLTAPAPLLHTFRLQIHAAPSAPPTGHCGFEMTKQLPGALFRGAAPLLQTLALSGALLPEDPCPAVARVTALSYDRIPHLKPAHLARVFALCPHLKRLTLTSRPHPTDVFAVLPGAAHLDELRVADVPRVEALLGALGAAKKVTRSFLFNPAPLAALRAMVLFPPSPCALPPDADALALGLGAAAAAHTGVHAHAFARVALGGRAQAVDVLPHAAHALLADADVRRALSAVRTLVAHERFLMPPAPPLALPALEELTVVTEWTPGPNAWSILHPAGTGTAMGMGMGLAEESTRHLRTLTVVFARLHEGAPLPAALVAHLVRCTLHAPPLERLVICRRGRHPLAVDDRLAGCAKRVVLDCACAEAESLELALDEERGRCRAHGHGHGHGHWVWSFPIGEAGVM